MPDIPPHIKRTFLLPLAAAIMAAATAAPLHALDLVTRDDAWAAGMGGAAAAVAGGTHASLLNPAGMATASVPMFQLGGAWGLEASSRDLRFGVVLPSSDRTVFGLTAFDALSPGNWENRLFVMGAAMPLQADGSLRAGMNVKVLQSRRWGDAPTVGHGLALDLGLSYDWRLKNGDALSMGLVARDLSGAVRRESGIDEDMARTFTFACAYQALPRMRFEADFDVVDRTLGETSLKNRLAFGVERFISQRRYSLRAGVDDLLGSDGSFRLGVGWHPDRPYEFQVAGGLSEKDQAGQLFASLVFRLDRWKVPGRTAEGAPVLEVETPAPGPGAPAPGRPVSAAPLSKVDFTVSPPVVSPNGDGKDDILSIAIPQILKGGIGRWELEIGRDKEAPARRFGGMGTPPPILTWDALADDGKPMPDGPYRAALKTYDASGVLLSDDSRAFEVRAVEAELILAASTGAFSPNGDGVKDQVFFRIGGDKAMQVVKWSFMVVPSGGGKPEMDVTGRGKPPRRQPWRGHKGPGEAVDDGVYTARLKVWDKADNMREAVSGPVTVDTRPPEVSLAPRSLTAKLGGKPVTFSLEASDDSRITSWRVTVLTDTGAVFKTVRGDGAPPARWTWDGTGDGPGAPKAAPGAFFGVNFQAVDGAGNKASAEAAALQYDPREAATGAKEMSLNLVTVFFEEKSPVLDPNAIQELKGAVESIRPYLAKSTLEVRGYTAPGEASDAVKLSHARAAAVRDFLAKELKLDPAAVPAVGRGDKEPLSMPGGGTPDDKQRRAVVTLVTQQ